MTAGDGQPELTAFQLEVARMFFALPASRGFLLAGGAALLAQHLTARPTEDLDFFTAPELARAAQIDAGFDTKVLADMIATLDRFTDGEIPIPDGVLVRDEELPGSVHQQCVQFGLQPVSRGNP